MRRPGPRRIAAAFVLVGSLQVGSSARADLVALVDYGASTGNLDITRINATTGTVLGLPAAVNTAAHEVHPSLSPDATRLVFLRSDTAAGTSRIIVVDLGAGQPVDLFSLFESSSDPPSTPVFSEDGTKILTGHRLPGSSEIPSLVETPLDAFPTGPFPHTVVPVGGTVISSSFTLQPSVGAGGLLAFHVVGPTREIVVRTAGGIATIPESGLGDPAIPRQGGTTIVFERVDSNNRRRLAFRPLDGVATARTRDLPAIVNARDTHVTKPAFSRDGRYLAFLRRPTNSLSDTRLFVLDTSTQLLLNSQGVTVKRAIDTDALSLHGTQGGIDLSLSSVFVFTGLTSGTLTFSLTQDSPIGIIVQRIVGKTRFLGRRVPKLKLVGRVPLGIFAAGTTHEVAWDRKVDGKRLRPGRYLVTLRSVTPDVQVLDLGEPVQIRIR